MTATVPSVALITSSILSKKLAESLDALVLDVKVGSGSFMPKLKQAQSLAHSLEHTAHQLGLPTRALITNMHQPLGRMVGNANEANEAVAVLQGQGPKPVRDLTIRLAAELLVACQRSQNLESASQQAREQLDSGRPMERYVQMIEGQGGSYAESLPLEKTTPIFCQQTGWLEAINGQLIGEAVVLLGGGRRVMTDAVNPQVGLEMCVEIGDQLEVGPPLANLFSNNLSLVERATCLIRDACVIVPNPIQPQPLIMSS